MQPRLFVPSLLLPLLAGLALGQEPLTNDVAMPRVDSLRQSTMLQPDATGLRAGGFDYEATFTGNGMRYVPALGPSAPTTQHLALRPLSVGRGGQVAVDLTADRSAPTIAAERRVRYAHGAALREHYDVTPQGLQLSWVFDAPVAGSGDLFVRYELDTTLPSAVAGDGLAFHLPRIGGVGIGGVTGIDAVGNRTPGSLRLDGSVLELRLPAAFVDAAKYPMVLDPLVGTQFLAETGGWNDMQPDVAYDLTNDIYLVVWRRVFSATSVGIRAQRISGAGALVGGFLAMTLGSVNAGRPTVANLNQRDTFVVAWQEAPTIWDPYDILAVSVNAANGAVSSPATAIASGVADQFNPDACGDNTTSDDEVLVAYQESVAGTGAGIKVAVVNVAAQGAAPTLVSTVVVTTSANARDPSMSNSQISTRNRVIVWGDQSGTTGQIRAQAMTRDAVLQGTAVTVTSGSVLLAAPGIARVDGDGINFLVVYEFGEIGAANGERNVWCRPLTWTGSALSLGTATAINTTATTDQKDPAVAFCRYKYVVAYADQFLPGSANYDIRGVELGANCVTCGDPFILAGLNGTLLRNVEFMPAIASKYGGGATTDNDALIVFAEADDSPPFTGSVIAQRYTAFGAGGAVTYVGSGCGVAGPAITVVGPFAAGNTDFQIQCTGVPAGAIPFLLFGFPGGEVTCGPCVYTNPVTSEFVLPSGGTASFFYRMPCSVYRFVGTTVQVQWALFGTAATPCPVVSSLSFTRRARLTLGL